MASAAVSRESAVLVSSLNSQRDHVLGILDGLPGDALRRPVLPSGWTPLGLVRHLAIDVERFWFRAITAGEQVELCEGAEAWQVGEQTPPETVFSLYRQEILAADAANGVIRIEGQTQTTVSAGGSFARPLALTVAR
jgi:Protein of unknown function (DUF664)